MDSCLRRNDGEMSDLVASHAIDSCEGFAVIYNLTKLCQDLDV